MRAAVDGAGRGSVLDDRHGIERHRSHVEEHAGDVKQGGEEKDALAAEENGEEDPGEALGEGSRGGLTRSEATAGFSAAADPRRPRARRRRR